MEAEKCNLLHDAHFRMWRASSACRRTFSACGEIAPHAEVPSRRAETLLHMRIGGGNGTASTATAVPKFDKWGLSRTKISSISL